MPEGDLEEILNSNHHDHLKALGARFRHGAFYHGRT